MKLYEILEHSVDRNRLIDSKEYRFFNSHKVVLENYSFFNKFNRVDDAFSLVQANIIIKGMINKLAVENIIKDDKDKIGYRVEKIRDKLIRFRHHGLYVYIPFMLPNHNNIYFKSPEKLLTFPYSQFVDDFSDSIIDCFDFYNFTLFQSGFSNLIYIDEDETTKAFYHPNLQVIFIINDQGRADTTIHLFDRALKDPHNENIVKRLSSVVGHYYAGDKVGFIDSLFINRLISEKLYRKIYKSLKIIKK